MRILYNPKLKQRSRELRNHSTLTEVSLWDQLKQRKMRGYQFMRQKPIHHYIVDFYCSKLHLVIEIDGNSHRNEFEEDSRRQQELESMGIHVLRVQDRDVKRDMVNVLRVIETWIEQYERTTP
jgi:very-short-patch-repair endonuclease